MTGAVPTPQWLHVDWLLGQYGQNRAVARLQYAKFVAAGRGMASPWTALKGQVLLGTENFVESLLPLIEKKGDFKEYPKTQRLVHRPELKTIFSEEVKVDKKVPDAAIRKAYLEFKYSMAAIARQVGIHYSTVSKVIKGRR